MAGSLPLGKNGKPVINIYLFTNDTARIPYMRRAVFFYGESCNYKFHFSSSRHTRETIYKLNFDIREAFYELNGKIWETFYKLPFTHFFRETFHWFYF